MNFYRPLGMAFVFCSSSLLLAIVALIGGNSVGLYCHDNIILLCGSYLVETEAKNGVVNIFANLG